jgi:hypothetical protein
VLLVGCAIVLAAALLSTHNPSPPTPPQPPSPPPSPPSWKEQVTPTPPPPWQEQVPPILPPQRVFTPAGYGQRCCVPGASSCPTFLQPLNYFCFCPELGPASPPGLVCQ